MLVLIVGGRYGGDYRGSEKSITNYEYEAAIKRKIPVFALVDASVLGEHHVYQGNRSNPEIDENSISYPSANDTRIFEFIDQVRKHLVNNAIVPFKDFSDIEEYLRKQWAGMLYEALNSESEAKRVSELFESLSETTKNVQFMTRQLVKGIDNKYVQLNIEFYDYMLASSITHDLSHWSISVSPYNILAHKTFDSITEGEIEITDDEGSSLTYGGPPYKLSQGRYDSDVKDYAKLRKHIVERLATEKITVDEFLSEIKPQSDR